MHTNTAKMIDVDAGITKHWDFLKTKNLLFSIILPHFPNMNQVPQFLLYCTTEWMKFPLNSNEVIVNFPHSCNFVF